MRIQIGLVAVVALGFFSIGFAHRSGCHRWHTCPSDTGSYSTTYTPSAVPRVASRVAAPRIRSTRARPRKPRYATLGAVYLRAADLLPKALGSVQRQRNGWYQLSVRRTHLWFRVGSRLARITQTTGAKLSSRTLKATPYVDQSAVYVPADVLRMAGCIVDASTISSGFVSVVCGNQEEMVKIKQY